MSLTTQLIYIVPIQISLSDSTAIITCSDPRAKIIDGEIVFTLNEPNRNDPPTSRRVCFVVEDLPDAGGYDNYFNMFSAPPLEQLVAWKRSGTISRSPEMLTGHKFEVVAVAYGVPRISTQPSATVKIGHGRRRFVITDPGAGGATEY